MIRAAAVGVAVVVASVSGCAEPAPQPVAATAPRALPPSRETVLDRTPKAARRAIQTEDFLRAYLMWFGGLDPVATFQRAHGGNLFDHWADYLAALGLPDYHVDAPRVSQSNTMMLATLGRLAEALCVRSAEHDLRAPGDARVVFDFDVVKAPSRAQFSIGFDVLHRTFLGYPARLAPPTRTDRYYALYRTVAANHPSGRLSADEMAWAAVCSALVQHPETGLY